MTKAAQEKEKNQEEMKQEKTDLTGQNGNMTQQEVDKLEAVRDLLFGQNVREYRDEFKELKDLLKSHRDELDKSADDFKTEILDKLQKLDEKFDAKIDATSKEINERLDTLSNDKADRKRIASLLSDMAQQLDS